MDGAMFDDKCTVLPIWVRDTLFNVTQRFPHRSKKDPESETSIVITHKGGKKTKVNKMGGKKTKVMKSMGKKTEMRGMKGGTKVENFKDMMFIKFGGKT